MLASFEYLQAEAQARIGTLIDQRWRLEKLLGVGGMAAVYEAVGKSGERRALKIVHEKLVGDERIFQRLRREASVVRGMNHPGIVRVYEVRRDAEGSLYLVMDLLSGFSFDLVRRSLGGALSGSHVRWVAAELLHILACAHEKGVLHRDLKPSNVYLTTDGHLKVLDFGVARRKESSGAANATFQTIEGSVLGTPTFMSPEQARGRWSEVDERSDLWSVGATLFTLASGRPVHEASNSTEALGLAMTAQARSLRELRPEFERRMAEVIDRALRYAPADRFPSAALMFSAITGERYSPRREPEPCPEMARRVAEQVERAPADDNPNLSTTIGHTRQGRARAASRAGARGEVTAADNASVVVPTGNQTAKVNEREWVQVLETQYWEVHIVPFAQIFVLKRTAEPIGSTPQLRQENLQVVDCLRPEYRNWGGVVDMRLAPARNDGDFEEAMKFLRYRLYNHLSRVSVLVSSAAGLLQVSRIDRIDGNHTRVTRDEEEAVRYAEGLLANA